MNSASNCSALLTFEVEVLKYNCMYRVQHCEFGNGGSNLLCKFVIQTACVTPEIPHRVRPLFTLLTFDSVQHMIQMVFVTRKIDELSLEDTRVYPICFGSSQAETFPVEVRVQRVNDIGCQAAV